MRHSGNDTVAVLNSRLAGNHDPIDLLHHHQEVAYNFPVTATRQVTVLERYAHSANKDKMLRESYMFDTGASVNLYNRSAMVWDIEPITDVRIAGVGNASVNHSCRGIWGPGYILDSLPFNVVSKHVLKSEGYHIEYDNQADVFVINGIGRFAYDPETDLNIMSRQESMMFTGSVNFETNKRLPSAFPNERVPLVDGKQFFNAVQLRRAKLCRKIHWVLNHPSDDVLKRLLDEGSICGCPLTGRDVTNMTKIFGPCKECLKGKTTSPHSQDVAFRRAIAEKPGEHIGIDVYFVTIISRMGKKVSIPFLLVSCYFSAYLHVLWLKSKTAGELWNRLNEVIQWYKGHGWEVKKVFSDRENVMGSIKRILHSCVPRIDMSRCGTDTHEKLVERYARVCRDKFQTVKASVW